VLGKPSTRTGFAVVCVALSAVFMFPALVVQTLRKRVRASELSAMAAKQAALEAQLAALQARTNPHFFFNSVNTVAALIPDDPVLAERTLERLADLFRYALDSSRTRTVPLAKEIAMVRDYLAIQGARFGSRLRSEVTLDPEAAEVALPPLLLQPLVENAILHGVGERKHGAVAVSARRDADRVVIEVRDDGPGVGASRHHGTGTSVEDLAARIRLHYGERGVLALEDAPAGGCVARLELPVRP
jgi:two-component system sensor histidine kinase AlgZ